MRVNSIRFKISVLYTAVLGIILIFYSGILYFGLRWTLYDDLDDELRLKAQAIHNTINSYLDILGRDQATFLFAVERAVSQRGVHQNEVKIQDIHTQWMQTRDKLDIENDYIDVINSEGDIIASAGDLQKNNFIFLSKKAKKTSQPESFMNVKFENRNLRVINVWFLYDKKKEYAIQVGTSLKPVIEILNTRLIFITTSIPILLLLTSFLGRMFAAKILKPVKEITKTAKNITFEDLGARVQAEHIDEEMQYLVNAFNEMIVRLERSFHHIAEFSSHVAHELKTPLAIMRGESELVLRKDHNVDECRRVIKGNLDEIGRMLKTIEGLLLLTKLEYRPVAFKFEEFEFSQFFSEICEQARLLAVSKNITVRSDIVSKQVKVKGDQIHLRRLFFNIIDNAVKFTPVNGKIDIAARCEREEILVAISDTGIGIPEENLPKIFDKFFHVDLTKSNTQTSTGLGLNIAQTIAKIHNGSIAVKSVLGQGSTFTITLRNV